MQLTPTLPCTQSTGTTQLPVKVAEELVLSAAREAFYSSAALDSPAVSRAQHCLALMPESAAAKAEADAITALLRLQREHGYAMLPSAFKEVRMRAVWFKVPLPCLKYFLTVCCAESPRYSVSRCSGSCLPRSAGGARQCHGACSCQ